MQWLRTLLALFASVIVIFVSSRLIVRALPGDPITLILAETGTELPREVLAEELGLDRPLLSALITDLWNGLQGDWGISLVTREPIGPLIVNRFKKTLLLTLSTLVLALPLSLWFGILAAQKKWAGSCCTLYGTLLAAMPTPWLGPILIFFFSVQLQWLAPSGALALPTLTLAAGFIGFWSRLIRERVQETLRTGAATGARARGVPEWKILWKYAFLPASGTLAAYFGVHLGHLLTGTLVTEVIFGWEGMGSLLVEAVLSRDYPVIEAGVFVTASCSLGGISMGRILQIGLDPRLRLSLASKRRRS